MRRGAAAHPLLFENVSVSRCSAWSARYCALFWLGCAALPLVGCSAVGGAAVDTGASTTTWPAPATATSATAGAAEPGTVGTPSTSPRPSRPDWLGRRTLPTDRDGFGLPTATPPVLVERALATVDTLPPPDGGFTARITSPAPDDAIDRSTWRDGCPVPPADLAYVTVSFWGFDDHAHTGELLVDRRQAEALVEVFRTLFAARFPIEEMRIVTPADLAADPTGDTNNTSSFVCRAATGGSDFSRHAFGTAIDVNPFQNPYVRTLADGRDRVLPELASAYLDREWIRPGMIAGEQGEVVIDAFEAIGWRWGGDWRTLKDYQHFSLSGR